MIGRDQIDRLRSTTVVDPDGNKVGTVGETFLGDDGEPRWVTVHTGLFGLKENFVPLDEAVLEGDALRIPYDKDTVKRAPHFDPESALTEDEERELHRHYDVTPSQYPMQMHVAGTAEQDTGGVDELPEERPRVATAPPPADRPPFESEGVMLHPDEDDQIRRSQVDFDGETGRDRV